MRGAGSLSAINRLVPDGPVGHVASPDLDPEPDWALEYEAAVADSAPRRRIERSGRDLWILYTGGTTGNPKGVMWPHANVAAISRRNYDAWGLPMPTTPDDIPAVLDLVHDAASLLASSPPRR